MAVTLSAGGKHLVSLSDHRPRSCNTHLQRTVVQLQSAVETLHRPRDETTRVCKRLEAVNSQIHHNTGKLHDAAAAACTGAMKRFVCIVIIVTVVISLQLFLISVLF